ncbi:hypothetical protein AJ80_01137 [Polytolypa hystricis UAMH7299]|uniref:F-box domain-containing protein n=1 Tax=Polytolypa hystricis (strain UAMH7299) TaxID=1447883 RepID=A0A2B7Z197_POLH7|nr:hypothetical protein AJ80_01137 [Polytolypa hystricis UAMH7299]
MPETHEPFQDMGFTFDELADVVHYQMPMLQVFSLHVSDAPIGEDDEGRIPGFTGSGLISLLDALPGYCTSLEVDTAGFDAYEEDQHLCEQLARMIPRLRHLRLRIGQMCPQMFAFPRDWTSSASGGEICGEELNPVAPHLRSLVINMELSRVLDEVERPCFCPSKTHTLDSEHIEEADRLYDEISWYLDLEVNEYSSFPASEIVVLLGHLHDPRFARFSILRRSDFINYKKYLHAFITIPYYCEYTGWTYKLWRCFANGDSRRPGSHLIAPWTHTREIIEGDVWRYTDKNERVPWDLSSLLVFEGLLELRLLFKKPDILSRYRSIPRYVKFVRTLYRRVRASRTCRPFLPGFDAADILDYLDRIDASAVFTLRYELDDEGVELS